MTRTQAIDKQIRAIRRRLTREANALRRQRRELAVIHVRLEGVTYTPIDALLACRIRAAEEWAEDSRRELAQAGVRV